MFHIAALLFSHSSPQTPVRATLEDGQILMGQVETRTLRLQSGVGLLEIPLSDVGEVVPAEGGGLGESEGRVDVWLRNGSELRGTWADPEIAMSIAVGAPVAEHITRTKSGVFIVARSWRKDGHGWITISAATTDGATPEAVEQANAINMKAVPWAFALTDLDWGGFSTPLAAIAD